MPRIAFPELNYPEIEGSVRALHLWSQIVGKYRLSHSPWLNHSWHATLYVTPRGLATGPIADNSRTIEILFDFHRHESLIVSSTSASASFALEEMSVAEFLARFKQAINDLNGTP